LNLASAKALNASFAARIYIRYNLTCAMAFDTATLPLKAAPAAIGAKSVDRARIVRRGPIAVQKSSHVPGSFN
jgi:hypothetical protein